MVHTQRTRDVLQIHTRQIAIRPQICLAYTIPDFKMKLLVRWEKDHKDDPKYMNKKFDHFRSCLQGVAVTKWDLCASKYKAEKRTEKNFKKC